MNDVRFSMDVVASERIRDREAFRRASQARMVQGQTLGRPRGVLTVEQAAARQRQVEGVESRSTMEVSNSTVQPPTSNLQPDPMRTVRLSLAAVLVLILVLVWIKQRKS